MVHLTHYFPQKLSDFLDKSQMESLDNYKITSEEMKGVAILF